MPKGLSIREFARRDGCSEKLVRRKIQSGHLIALDDGSIDPKLVGTAWRDSARPGADTADSPQVGVRSGDDDPQSIGEIAERLIEGLGAAGGRMMTKAEAETLKENCIALLRQIELDRERGAVAEVEEIAVQVAGEYTLVRTRLLNIGAKVAPRVAVMKSAEEIKALIDREVATVLKELTLDQGGRAGGTGEDVAIS